MPQPKEPKKKRKERGWATQVVKTLGAAALAAGVGLVALITRRRPPKA